MQRKRAVAAAVVIGVLWVAVPLVSGAVNGSKPVLVDVESAALRTIQPSILASGELAHEEEVNLTSEVIGRVEAVYVDEGERVHAGQLVLAIDNEAYAAQVEQSRAAWRLEEINIDRVALNVENLERRFARSERLHEQRLLDEHSFEAARHELEAARIDLRSAKERLTQARARLDQSIEQLEKTRLRAPIDGVVTALDIEVGETAIASSTNIPGSQLMTIADPSRVITEVHVDEADVANVYTGQKAEIVAIAYPRRPLTGVVEFVANTARRHPERRGLSFLVRVRIAETNGIRLRPGMSCRAEIFTAEANEALALPIQAIVAEDTLDETAQHVYVADEGVVRKVEVQTGRSDDAWQEILTGLEPNQSVVVGPARALRQLRDGDAIEVRESDGDEGDLIT